MNKVLLVSGSNRRGNTEYLLLKLKGVIKNSELLLLREKKIEFCKGCLYCHNKENCIIKDDMSSILDSIKASDYIIFGVPNYFDNVSGIFKNFIDRLHPLYKSEKIKNKKVIFLFIGGGKVSGTATAMHEAIKGMVKYLQLDVRKEYSFQALNINDMKEEKDIVEKFSKEIKDLVE